MTFDDDFIRLGDGGPNVRCALAGLSWPPPEKLIDPNGTVWERDSFSAITDEQREGMSFVARGAEYLPSEGGA